jgi:hypothetical protein
MHLSSAYWHSRSTSCSEQIVTRYKRAEDARMALEQMEGFELAGRVVCIPRFRNISENSCSLEASSQYCS